MWKCIAPFLVSTVWKCIAPLLVSNVKVHWSTFGLQCESALFHFWCPVWKCIASRLGFNVEVHCSTLGVEPESALIHSWSPMWKCISPLFFSNVKVHCSTLFSLMWNSIAPLLVSTVWKCIAPLLVFRVNIYYSTLGFQYKGALFHSRSLTWACICFISGHSSCALLTPGSGFLHTVHSQCIPLLCVS